MKLIKRTTLIYQEGSSDKVYEVDLCQTGENLYVVNFRYGRRGTNLKEGVKTDAAVPLSAAEKAFNELVASKVKKGYRDASVDIPKDVPKVPTAAPISETGDVRKQAILNRLATTKDNKKWPLERAIWRAGELKISEATPRLLQLIDSGNALRNYCLAAALGWCGGKGAIPALINLYQNDSTPEFVSRIAFEALLKLTDDGTKAALKSEMIEFLPAELKQLASNGSAESFSRALRTYLDTDDYTRFSVLDKVYQIDNEYVRPALLETLRTAPFKPNYFKYIRHIFKMAEYRQDAEVFGILTYRFEREKELYRYNEYYIRLADGSYLSKYTSTYNVASRRYDRFENPEFDAAIKGDNAKVAYSDKTRAYFLRRLWRSLRRFGEEGDRNYVKMAVGILLQYSDTDAGKARKSTYYRYERPTWNRVAYHRSWDSYASYLTFNHILYENSPRYVLKPNSRGWRCNENYNPGDPEPEVREEAFPQLWEQQPQALLQLLVESNCHPVQNFAAKAFRACQSFWTEIDIQTIISLINKPYEATAQIAAEIARERYNRANPNLELVLALVNCLSQQGRNQAYRWIEEQRPFFLENIDFILALVISNQSETRAFARSFLSSAILNDTTARVLVGRIIAELLALDSKQAEIIKEIGETLVVSFAPQLRNISITVILDFLMNRIPEIQEIGARILLNHEIRAIDLPPELITSLLASSYESIRVIGVRIFGQLPDERLLNQAELLVAMAAHKLSDMRDSVRPIIRRLAIQNPEFLHTIVPALITVLAKQEKKEGIHNDVVRLLKEDLPYWMSGVTKQDAMKLLQSPTSAVQELGGIVLKEKRDRFLQEFDTSEIVKLASHEILAVREAAREMFLERLPRIRTNPQELLAAVRILEAKWEDSQKFAKNLFSEFSNDEWTPEVMVAICDSIKEDVRQFGRNLVTSTFQESYGQDYLLKFSEHPSADMQLFVTNYLERYAVDNPTHLRELIPYFITVLSNVNRGGVAKKRVFAFLDAEAQKSEAAAKVVGEILTRQSATIAITDKAKAIQTMVKIRQKYPQIELPIQVKAVTTIRS